MTLRSLKLALRLTLGACALALLGAQPASAQAPATNAPPAGTARVAPPAGFRMPDPTEGRKKVLFIGDLQTGVSVAHDWSMSHAVAVLERLGRETGAFDLYVQTDTHLITKAQTSGGGDRMPGRSLPGRNLDYFDAVVFYTNGETEMTDAQKKDLLAFVHDDGKGFVGIHTATATLYQWPEYGEMIGAYFDNHPWNVIEAPVIVEEPSFPAMKGYATGARIKDEMYAFKAPYSRDKVDVLARLDPRALDLANKAVHRTDGDFPIAWIKSYGQGRVFYSGLGHPVSSWDDPRMQQMYVEAIKWVLRETPGEPRPHPMTPAP